MRKETRMREGITYHLRYYNDWLDFVSFAERVQRGQEDGEFGGMSCSSLEHGDAPWYGTESLAEAITLARRGWPEGRFKVRDVRKMLDVKSLLPNSRQLQVLRDVSGDEPDVDLYLSGEPESMITMSDNQVAQRGKVVRSVLNRTALSHVDSNQIVLRGVALMIAFETLIRLGYSPDLTICFSDESSDFKNRGRIEWYIPVLRAGDPMNMDTLAFMFIQPAVMRRLRFAASECEHMEIRKLFGFYRGGGYGSSCDPIFLPEHDLFLRWEDGLAHDVEEVVPFVLDILNQLGIEWVGKRG